MLDDSPASSQPIHFTEPERAKLSRLVDYSSVRSLSEIWSIAKEHFGETIALKDPHVKPEVVITYAQLDQEIRQFAASLQALGVKPESRVALFADNSPRWLIADQGIMTSGAIDVVRSAQADREELLFILADSGSTTLVVEDSKTLKKLRNYLDLAAIGLVILLSDEQPDADETLKVLNYPALMAVGSNHQLQPISRSRQMLATLMYTSGTTGKPRGVMLSHGNLLHQVTTFGVVVQPQVGAHILSILPTWHVYERTVEYFLLSQGCTQVYTNIRHIKRDFKEFKPQYMVGVPRIWESIYEGVQKQFREQPASKQRLINFLLANSQRYIEARRIVRGLSLKQLHPSTPQRLAAGIQTAALQPLHALADRLVYRQVREQATGGQTKQLISGGGSLAMHLENFFEIVGIEILVGYGLTETSPVTNVRRPERNLRPSAGPPMPATEIQIVDSETLKPVSSGKRGLVMVRGPQIMQGYYQNPEATAKAIDAEGWFNTGDLGWVTPDNDLVLTGRAKDTIVLTNGENIEPLPIEDACLRSPYIHQIVLVGQDQRSLGALIVPNLEALQQWAVTQNQHLIPIPIDAEETTQSNSLQTNTPEIHLDSQIVQDLFRQELTREVQNRPGYRPDDRIGPFKLILEPFSQENGMLTQTLKIKRLVVMERYHGTINEMFA